MEDVIHAVVIHVAFMNNSLDKTQGVMRLLKQHGRRVGVDDVAAPNERGIIGEVVGGANFA